MRSVRFMVLSSELEVEERRVALRRELEHRGNEQQQDQGAGHDAGPVQAHGAVGVDLHRGGLGRGLGVAVEVAQAEHRQVT